MLNAPPPGQATQGINRQLSQNFSIPGMQQQSIGAQNPFNNRSQISGSGMGGMPSSANSFGSQGQNFTPPWGPNFHPAMPNAVGSFDPNAMPPTTGTGGSMPTSGSTPGTPGIPNASWLGPNQQPPVPFSAQNMPYVQNWNYRPSGGAAPMSQSDHFMAQWAHQHPGLAAKVSGGDLRQPWDQQTHPWGTGQSPAGWFKNNPASDTQAVTQALLGNGTGTT